MIVVCFDEKPAVCFGGSIVIGPSGADPVVVTCHTGASFGEGQEFGAGCQVMGQGGNWQVFGHLGVHPRNALVH